MILPLFKCITCLVKVSAKLSNYFLIFLISFKRWRYFLKMSYRARASPSVFSLCCDHSDQFVLGPFWPICPPQLRLKRSWNWRECAQGHSVAKNILKGNISTKALKIMMPPLSITIKSWVELTWIILNPIQVVWARQELWKAINGVWSLLTFRLNINIIKTIYINIIKTININIFGRLTFLLNIIDVTINITNIINININIFYQYLLGKLLWQHLIAVTSSLEQG